MKKVIPILIFTVLFFGCKGTNLENKVEQSAEKTSVQNVEKIDKKDIKVLSLPDGFSPDGIAIAKNGTIYVASFFNGKIVRGNIDDSEITDVLVEGLADRPGWGMDLDKVEKHLFVAGGFAGTARIYNANTGVLDAEITLTKAGIVNDVIVTETAAYFTNSALAELYEIPLDKNGNVAGEARTITLKGDFKFDASYFANANGIEATSNGAIIVNHSFLGKMYLINPATGIATEIDLGGEKVSSDGIALDGLRLYGTEPMKNQVAELKLSKDFNKGNVVKRFSAEILDFPTLIALHKSYVFIVNAKLNTKRSDSVSYQIVRFSR